MWPFSSQSIPQAQSSTNIPNCKKNRHISPDSETTTRRRKHIWRVISANSEMAFSSSWRFGFRNSHSNSTRSVTTRITTNLYTPGSGRRNPRSNRFWKNSRICSPNHMRYRPSPLVHPSARRRSNTGARYASI